VRETPRLVRVYEEFKDQGFVMLGVNTAYQDKRDAVTTFVRDQKISYPVLLDTDGAFSTIYGGRLMPTSYLIDRDGKIVVTKVGEVDEAQLREQITALLRGETP
jgi:peroxiredoxin